ncbi:MAG: hypothetical protein H0U37_08020 [Chloroflexi bacterium]|nr:hypothetical protein [Chloroflexota bacterium]
MDAPAPPRIVRPRTAVRIALTPEQAEALERRARRNDRFAWLEAGRIVREALVRDGDLPAAAAGDA